MLNIAVIGSGYWGTKVVDTLKQNPNVNIVQVIDIKNNESIDDIYSDITTAIIATPLWDHFSTAVKLLDRGFDIYVEKPMAETAGQVSMLARHINNHVVMVGHIFVYHPALDYIKANLPRLGTIKHIHSERLNWGIYQTKTTPLLSLLPHDISIMLELGNDITVTGARQQNFTDNQVPDWISVDLKMGNVTATVTGSWYWPERVRKLTIIGTAGSIVWDDAVNQVHVFQGQVNERRLTDLKEEIHVPDLTVTPLQRELDHFVSCVLTRQQPKTDIKNALAVAKILDAAQERVNWAGQYLSI